MGSLGVRRGDLGSLGDLNSLRMIHCRHPIVAADVDKFLTLNGR